MIRKDKTTLYEQLEELRKECRTLKRLVLAEFANIKPVAKFLSILSKEQNHVNEKTDTAE